MDFYTIASIVGLSSIVTVMINFICSFFEKKRMLKFEKRIAEKECRYRSILVFMLVVLDPSNLRHTEISEADYQIIKGLSADQIKGIYYEKIEANYIFAYLYASNDVLKKIKAFLDNPTQINYLETAKTMRKDLWM